MSEINNNIASSFRDPSGFVFEKNGVVYRQINKSYQTDYDIFISSGLFRDLIDENLIINHREIKDPCQLKIGYKIIKPDKIPFISYPYEWCFSQLKDAALLTLSIQNIALKHNMTLKDASVYNVQYFQNKPIFIDTLSFEKYQNDTPWVAYRQFCQHFLAPLALMSYVDIRLNSLLRTYLDGIPLDLAVRILPKRTWFSFGMASHLHLHAISQQQNEKKLLKHQKYNLSKNQLLAILDSLKSSIKSLQLPRQNTTWEDYYNNTNYSNKALKQKEKIIFNWIKSIKPKSLWDAGANDGHFSRIASESKIFTLSTDFDHLAVEQSYLRNKKQDDKFILPLIIDMVNPSPSIGWANQERPSFLERCTVDLTLCLALIHHLAISNNLPFSYIAKLFSKVSKRLIIEFVPKNDTNAKRLIANRLDIFSEYNQENFEKEFSLFFSIKKSTRIKGSYRILYLMERINNKSNEK